jgi:hypothetical protein
MRPSILAGVAAAALLLAGMAPASTASAASAQVAGVVVDGATPQGGILVGWYQPSTGAKGTTTSDATGHYVLPIPAAGAPPYVLYTNLDLGPADLDDFQEDPAPVNSVYIGTFYGQGAAPQAVDAKYSFQQLTPFSSAGGPGSEVTLPITRPGTIAAVVTAFAGEEVTLANSVGGVVTTTKAGRDGRFSFTGLVPGRYTIRSDYESFGPLNEVTVVAGQTTSIDLGPQHTGTITGVVRHGRKALNGRRLGLEVTARSTTGESFAVSSTVDSRGRYSIAGLPPGNHRVRVSTSSLSALPHEGEARVVGLAAGATVKRDVRVRVGGAVTARIISSTAAADSEDSEPLSAYLVGGKPTVGDFDIGDKVSLAVEKKGSYTLFATDGERYAKKKVKIRSGRTTSAGDLRLSRPNLVVRGRIKHGAGASVSVYSTSMIGFYQDTVANRRGEYELRLLPGTYRMLVDGDRYSYSSPAVKVTKDSTKNIVASEKPPKPKSKPRGKVKASFTVAGLPVKASLQLVAVEGGESTDLDTGGSSEHPIAVARVSPGLYGVGVSDENLSVRAVPGGADVGRFQQNSPFVLSYPPYTPLVRVVAGRTTVIPGALVVLGD